MTLQLRPTFSESWYRVKDLKPRMRAAAQISRQWYRGERWYVVRDPAGNQYHRLSDIAYSFVGLLDGTRTVGEAWELVGGQLADDAPTQPEVIQILSQLYAANLIETNIAPDAQVLLRRYKKQRQRKFQGRLMNILFPRIPLWDPDRFLKRWMPLVGPLISKWGAALWVIVNATAIAVLLPRFGEFKSQTTTFLESGRIEMWLVLGATFLVTKFLHEMGHAFTNRKFGGEVHEVGVMFLVLMPCPYVDASTAWGFANKWARILVAAGGMIAELFVASIAVFVWAATGPEHAIHQIAYYTILIASVSTILFNANPLLRYDGYYMLSDFLEIPNLQMRSREYTLGLIRRYLFRVKSTQPLPPTLRQKIWLVVYSITSTAYRIFIGFAILLMVIYQLPEAAQIIGMLLAAGAIATFFIVPTVKLFKYLTTDPELHRKRTRAWAFTMGTVAMVVVLLGIIPFPHAVRAEGITESASRGRAIVRTAGRVIEIPVRDGQQVKAGDVLLRLENHVLQSELKAARHELEAAEIILASGSETSASAERIAREQRDAALARTEHLQQQVDELTVLSAIDGRLSAPDIEQALGRYLKEGDMVGEVRNADQLEVFVVVDQGSYERIRADEDRRVQIRLASDIGTQHKDERIKGVRLMPKARSEVRNSALTFAGGGNLAPDPQDPKRIAGEQFELRVIIDNPRNDAGQVKYLPGQRAYVRVKLEDEPLALQWWRKFLQLIQSQRTIRSANQQ